MSIFTGSAVAIVTPFKKDGSVDYDKFRDVIEYQIAGGTDCIVVCGTTGESSTLSHEEHLDCIRSAQRLSTSVFRLLQEQVQIVQRQLFICLRKQRSTAWMVCLL